jgi:hypothetical protein
VEDETIRDGSYSGLPALRTMITEEHLALHCSGEDEMFAYQRAHAIHAAIIASSDPNENVLLQSQSQWRSTCESNLRGGINDPFAKDYPVNIAVYKEGCILIETLRAVHITCVALTDGIVGTIPMTTAIERDLIAFCDDRVPSSWSRVSGGDRHHQSLSAWCLRLRRARAQLVTWVRSGEPGTVALGLFELPAMMISAVQQRCGRYGARNSSAPSSSSFSSSSSSSTSSSSWHLENVKIDAEVMALSVLPEHPPIGGGMYFRGLRIQGAAWATKAEAVSNKKGLVEGVSATTMLPIVKFSAIDTAHSKAKVAGDYVYECPVYAGSTTRGVIAMLKLNTYRFTADHWALRGVAIYC